MRKLDSVARLIGRFDQGNPGPLVVIIGGMHGNEPAGIYAAEALLRQLHKEAEAQADFHFRGRLLCLVGNVAATRRGQRFLAYDLNRLFTSAKLTAYAQQDTNGSAAALNAEPAEALDLIRTIKAEVAEYQPERVIVVDVHTTTADGGAFTIVADDAPSLKLALQLHAPVVLGMLAGLKGTSLQGFSSEQLGVTTANLVFEAGQHQEPAAVRRAQSVLTLILQEVGCIDNKAVSERHAASLHREYKALPEQVRLAYVHRIKPSDRFVMRPGYVNFQPVEEGQVVADDVRGPIAVKQTGRLLMPLYQAQGSEGFFLVTEPLD